MLKRSLLFLSVWPSSKSDREKKKEDILNNCNGTPEPFPVVACRSFFRTKKEKKENIFTGVPRREKKNEKILPFGLPVICKFKKHWRRTSTIADHRRAARDSGVR